VLFVCRHGAARSRIAAAYFNAEAPTGWCASTAASEEPAVQVNPAAAALLAGSTAAEHLDLSLPRPLAGAGPASVVIAIDCPTLPGATPWNLHSQVIDEALRDELHTLVATLARTLPDPAGDSGR
jgi:protein-tyrosine-phosphatase